FGKIARAIGQHADNLFQQQAESVLLQGGDGNDLCKIVQLAVVLDQRQQPVLGQFVDLVKQQKNRASRALHQAKNVLIAFSEFFPGVDDQQDQVAGLQRFVNLLQHFAVQSAIGTMYAGRVDEDNLRCRAAALRLEVHHSLDARARGLRLGSDNG